MIKFNNLYAFINKMLILIWWTFTATMYLEVESIYRYNVNNRLSLHKIIIKEKYL
jgi:hypothetical protein